MAITPPLRRRLRATSACHRATYRDWSDEERRRERTLDSVRQRLSGSAASDLKTGRRAIRDRGVDDGQAAARRVGECVVAQDAVPPHNEGEREKREADASTVRQGSTKRRQRNLRASCDIAPHARARGAVEPSVIKAPPWSSAARSSVKRKGVERPVRGRKAASIAPWRTTTADASVSSKLNRMRPRMSWRSASEWFDITDP